MNRWITNKIRFVLDECLPPLLRDARWFMWPFFYFCYRGKDIAQMMDFKKNIYHLDSGEIERLYTGLNSISRNRKADLTLSCMKHILNMEMDSYTNLLDVGCGKGFLLKKFKHKWPFLSVEGCDIVNVMEDKNIIFNLASITHLPFPDHSFDVVVCSHTIEHIIPLTEAILELKRIVKHKLIIVTPRQRYYYYTLDEHVNFFPQKEILTNLIGFKNFECKLIGGDWLYASEFASPIN